MTYCIYFVTNKRRTRLIASMQRGALAGGSHSFHHFAEPLTGSREGHLAASYGLEGGQTWITLKPGKILTL
jgi:hypothetical protein